MVNLPRSVPLTCLLALLPLARLQAADPASFHLGETADQDVSTPVALDVINPDATATRRAAEALKTPAIFRSYPDLATNAVATDFQTVFAGTRTGFLAALKGKFSAPLADGTIESPEFDKFVATFNARNKTFPVGLALADDWARGEAGTETETRLTGALLKMMHRPVCPDTLPAGFAVGDTLRLVPVKDPDTAVTLATAERDGKIITASSLTTLTRLRMLLRREFPENEQALARALGTFLAPNCVPDTALTAQARKRDTGQLVVVDHYNAGDLILRRGQVVDVKAKAALDELHDRIASGQLDQQIAAERDLARRAQEQAQQEHDRAQLEQAQAQQARDQAQAEHEQLLKLQDQALTLQIQAREARLRNQWLLIAFAGICGAGLLMFGWQWRQRRRPLPALVPARPVDVAPQTQAVIQSDFAPHLARAIKEALVQELAAQRSELLQAQRAAALEIASLVQRLDTLQTPLHERLRAYETRIQELEKELTMRNEENRELLKLKIEMIRQQIEAERSNPRLKFN